VPDWLGGTCRCENGCVADIDIEAHLTSLPVAARSSESVTRSCKVGDRVVWEFHTENNNINFSCVWKGKDGSEKVLVANQKFESHNTRVTGQGEAPGDGMFILCFDNTYSMLTKKEVFYYAEIEPLASLGDEEAEGGEGEERGEEEKK